MGADSRNRRPAGDWIYESRSSFVVSRSRSFVCTSACTRDSRSHRRWSMIERTSHTNTPRNAETPSSHAGAGENHLEHLEGSIPWSAARSIRTRRGKTTGSAQFRDAAAGTPTAPDTGPDSRPDVSSDGSRWRTSPTAGGCWRSRRISCSRVSSGIGRLLETTGIPAGPEAAGIGPFLRRQAGGRQRQNNQDQRRVSNAMHTPKYGELPGKVNGPAHG